LSVILDKSELKTFQVLPEYTFIVKNVQPVTTHNISHYFLCYTIMSILVAIAYPIFFH